jgi:formylglycine-generating enzyme
MRTIGFLAAVALLGAIACDSVLDIDEPSTRPEPAAGEGGEPPTPMAGTNAGGMSKGMGGNAGEGATTPLLGGAAGQAGESGAAGAPTPKDCEPGDRRCTELAPEICDETGHWVANTDEADGNCAELCVAGKCAECEAGQKRCPVCEEGDQNCLPNLPQTCVDGAWQDADAPCKAYCDAGECVKPPSCTENNAPLTTCRNGVSCCASLRVPGGTFLRRFDNDEWSDGTFPAYVSPFYLDKFEVTVGRFRQFLSAYGAIKLKDGDGKSEHIATDQGWNTRDALPSKTDLVGALSSCSGSTWSSIADGDDDQHPINCVPFNVAYAFCIWDGGRLPTETEWNFAAAGGDEQRVYPWKAPLSGPMISGEFANYGDAQPGPALVGLTPAGDGRWGQSDLSGNVAEWTLDYWGDLPQPCNDCLNTTAADERVVRGGYFRSDEYLVKVSFATSSVPDAVDSFAGFRCARDLKVNP